MVKAFVLHTINFEGRCCLRLFDPWKCQHAPDSRRTPINPIRCSLNLTVNAQGFIPSPHSIPHITLIYIMPGWPPMSTYSHCYCLLLEREKESWHTDVMLSFLWSHCFCVSFLSSRHVDQYERFRRKNQRDEGRFSLALSATRLCVLYRVQYHSVQCSVQQGIVSSNTVHRTTRNSVEQHSTVHRAPVRIQEYYRQ